MPELAVCGTLRQELRCEERRRSLDVCPPMLHKFRPYASLQALYDSLALRSLSSVRLQSALHMDIYVVTQASLLKLSCKQCFSFRR